MASSHSSEQPDRVASLFDEIVELESGARRRFLDDLRSDDPELCGELESLLAAHDRPVTKLHRLLDRLPLAKSNVEPGTGTLRFTGRQIGHYGLLEKLGAGGMGVVYRAHDPRLDRSVALKFLPAHLHAEKDAKERFVREAKAASALDHPNICAIYDIGETDSGQIFMVMAFYPGETLKDKIARGPLPLDVATDLAMQVARGLEKAHAADIVHRDIKPANLLVTDDDMVKILDFGIAKVVGADLTRSGATMGTVAYMSPEQVRGESVDGRSDLWSLGAVLYEMVTGSRCFQGDSDAALIFDILQSDPDMEAIRDPALASVIASCLTKDRNQRLGSAGDLIEALSGVASGRRVAAKQRKRVSSRKSTETTGVSRQAKVAWSGLGGLVLIALTVLGYNFFSANAPVEAIQSVAVLPLENLSGDPDQEYFVDGMTDALITELSTIAALRVISRRSTMRFKDSRMSAKKIANDLGVDAIVAGSVLRVDDAVRVNAQLISAESEENIWAESFDRNMVDILSLHSEVARSIVDRLKVSLTADEEIGLARAKEVDPAAYEAFLKGRFHWYRLSPENLQSALDQFNLALQIDPNFAEAYVGVSRVWSAAGLWGGVESKEAIRKSSEAVDKALTLDPNLAEAYYVKGVFNFVYLWKWQEAEAPIRRAIELSPNTGEWHTLYADYLNSMRRHDEAVAEARQGVTLDPLSAFSYAGLGWVLLGAGDLDAAMDAHDRALEIDPSIPFALRGRWLLNYLRGDSSAAVADAAAFYEIQGLGSASRVLRSTYVPGSYRTAMRAAALELETLSDTTFVSAMRIARLYMHAGDQEKVIDLIEKSVQQRFPSVAALNVDPQWDEVRRHPRFRALITGLGLPTDVSR